ncbi:hypothetical protein BDY17DRAFT_254061 [Neohortaea acidophila]|uniref:Uncharacterized protein n=1 Tax=Neohortaea acidophila TaxID=245834 RepID=A0A6A6PMA8_9PEZI|nr:uncharacterized protein BDY17DRAFT_254061 [Neohortaea acidophila]KAF2481045.1 hypothetical protein BDY17DRAFT_254061 [Neohortaea acidophila]
MFPHDFPKRTKTPIIEVARANAYVPHHSTTSSLDPKTPLTALPPPPPPPPPPPLVTGAQGAPRVDYLLKNGGLSNFIPRRLVTTHNSVTPYSTYQSPSIGQLAPIEDYAKIFTPLHKRLDDYLHVLRNNGSLAVATGYKSVARRLLDKLSQLDIDVPEEYKEHYIRQNQKTKKAVQNWLALQPEFPSSPPEEADEDTLMFAMMTKLDAQQRNYFIALMHGQSSISRSRAPTPAERPSAPSEALRRASNALQRLYRLMRSPRDCESAMYLLNNPHLHGMLATLAEVNEQEWEILVSGRFDGFLWSGAEAPFPPSVSGYNSPISRGPSRGPSAPAGLSRNPTPFSGLSGVPLSRTQTPYSPLRNITSPDQTPPAPIQTPAPQNGNNTINPSRSASGTSTTTATPPPPVQLDEDTELAVLAEVERNLFNDMERFEDAFEILHSRAELVRQLLRQRSAALAMQASVRRGAGAADSVAAIRLDTPASAANTDIENEAAFGEGVDDGLEDLASLAPDDSASQISVGPRRVGRHRRRWTPGPQQTAAVAEEGFGGGGGGGDEGSLFEEQVRYGHRYEYGARRSRY